MCVTATRGEDIVNIDIQYVNHGKPVLMLYQLPSRKSEVMLNGMYWLEEEQARECPKQKHLLQPSGFSSWRLKEPGLHLQQKKAKNPPITLH